MAAKKKAKATKAPVKETAKQAAPAKKASKTAAKPKASTSAKAKAKPKPAAAKSKSAAKAAAPKAKTPAKKSPAKKAAAKSKATPAKAAAKPKAASRKTAAKSKPAPKVGSKPAAKAKKAPAKKAASKAKKPAARKAASPKPEPRVKQPREVQLSSEPEVPKAAPAESSPASEGEFGPAEEYSRTKRLKEPQGNVMKWALKAKDWWEESLAEASPHGDPGVYDSSNFWWTNKLENNWKVIRKELDGILDRRSEMPSFHEIMKEVSTITKDDDWKTFFLVAPGMDCSRNREKCPETTKLVTGIPGIKTAMFSILSPRKHIPAHRGPYAGVLRYHLGLIVPEPREKCRIRIGNQAYTWEEGKSLVFDDTFNHEVWNDTDGVRVVLFIDFVRPLHWPHDWINRAGIEIAPYVAPFLKKANNAQKNWEAKFYGEKKED